MPSFAKGDLVAFIPIPGGPAYYGFVIDIGEMSARIGFFTSSRGAYVIRPAVMVAFLHHVIWTFAGPVLP